MTDNLNLENKKWHHVEAGYCFDCQGEFEPGVCAPDNALDIFMKNFSANNKFTEWLLGELKIKAEATVRDNLYCTPIIMRRLAAERHIERLTILVYLQRTFQELFNKALDYYDKHHMSENWASGDYGDAKSSGYASGYLEMAKEALTAINKIIEEN
jgi:hypothetical protein